MTAGRLPTVVIGDVIWRLLTRYSHSLNAARVGMLCSGFAHATYINVRLDE
jgi:hypothetical protein